MKAHGRYEMKFILEEDRAVAVADYVRAFMQPSEYNGNRLIRGYPIVSLYLDSPDYLLYWQVACGHRNRLKLRIRFYDDLWERPAYLEIKRRVNDNIMKDRAIISRAEVQRFLKGGWPNPSVWPMPEHLKNDSKEFDIYFRFWQLSAVLKAKPIAYLSYIREAYVSPADDELRVTFDRHISATPYDESAMLNEDIGKLMVPRYGASPPPDRPSYHLPFDGIVLELKFEERAPQWMCDMVRVFNLERHAMSKYGSYVESAMLSWGKPPLPEDNLPLSLCVYD